MNNVTNKSLFIQKAFINGTWVTALNQKLHPVYNPFDQSLIGSVPDMGIEETKQAIHAAYQAFPLWKSYIASERANLLYKWYQLILENADDLATILTVEQGKPLAEAKGEVSYGASFVEWFAEEAKRVYGDVIPGHGKDKRILVTKEPVGVVAAITPWNFPIAMITRKVAPALASGCTVVIKPAEDTPFSALAIAYLAEKAGIPKGVINVITTSEPAKVGAELCANPLVRKLSFTGSTPVGKIIMKQCADTVKKLSLELGGNAPFIVLDDAIIDDAVAGAIASKYRNAGQTCVCTNRIYVQEAVYDEFCEKFTHAVNKLRMGDGLAPNVEIGPLINPNAVAKVAHLVNQAVANGAKVLAGGRKQAGQGNFYEPTVLADVTGAMEIAHEEIFGPVAPIFKFKTDAEIIALANNTPYGLASYFYGQNINRIFALAEGLEYGMIGINTGMISTAVAPFGGVKQSGIGREGSKYGIEEFLEIKYMCFGGIQPPVS